MNNRTDDLMQQMLMCYKVAKCWIMWLHDNRKIMSNSFWTLVSIWLQ